MQKIINVLSISAFVISASALGGCIYVFANKDAILEGVKEKIIREATGAVGDSVKGMLPSIPTVPTNTGGAKLTGGDVSLPRF